MRIAVVGSGIAGISAAASLSDSHLVTLFEAEDRIGGHTNTVDVAVAGETIAVDTGFIVFNERNYPVFCSLLDQWGVDSQESDMSFSVVNEATGLEYSGAGLRGIFAQRRRVFSPSYYRLLFEIMRFGRIGHKALEEGALSSSVTTEEFLNQHGFSRRFRSEYLIPLGAAVWSADPRHFTKFPAAGLLRFLHNHGLLLFRDRPKWRTITGGSARYLEAFEAHHSNVEIRRLSPVTSVRRTSDEVILHTPKGEEAFDAVVLALHSDDALQLLDDPSPLEKEILGAIGYQANTAILHTDTSVMPKNRRAWASWNYQNDMSEQSLPTLTYWMNRLQSLACDEEMLVTLNRLDDIAPSSIFGVFEYRHPVYDVEAFDAQQRWEEINGVQRTYFAGAWWGYGFHEDGAASGRRAAESIGS